MRIIGLMSGTSADGIDACLANITERGGRLSARVEAFLSVPYTRAVRRRVLEAGSVGEVCRLNFELGELFAKAALAVCDKAGVKPSAVDAIGSHGQTVWHAGAGPRRSTLQIAEPCVIAQRTGITTVADFRGRDIAAGGCGAPLVPIVDFLLLAHQTVDRVALNIGGIANVTLLPAGCAADGVVAFDTGPGNMVIDGLIERLTGGRKRIDRGGKTAARGRMIEPVLAELLRDRYYTKRPPKSTGREKYGRHFVEELLALCPPGERKDEDVLATAAALTARTIADAIHREFKAKTRGRKGRGEAASLEVIASGGGVHNATVMRMLREAMPQSHVVASDERGIPADAKEALAFAVLAYLTLHGRPGNVPGATGADESVVLGKIVPGKSPSSTRSLPL